MQLDTRTSTSLAMRTSKAWGKIGFAKRSVRRELQALHVHASNGQQAQLTAKPRLVQADQPLRAISLEEFLRTVRPQDEVVEVSAPVQPHIGARKVRQTLEDVLAGVLA
jgi:hypothetical protein